MLIARPDRRAAAVHLTAAAAVVTDDPVRLVAALGVSVATARRDLAALAETGVPVRPRPGRGRGWDLLDP